MSTSESEGYSLGAGAPKPPTKSDLMGILMVVEDIEEAVRIKWRHGVDEHRDGDASLPFNGDPVAELHAEGLDALSFLRVLRDADDISDEMFQLGQKAALTLVRLARHLNGGRI